MTYSLLVGMLFSAVTAVSLSAERQKDVDALDRSLRDAVFAGTASEVRDSLRKGADPRAVDRFGTTLLMHAAVRGKVKAVESLLAAGADPDARDEDDQTALFFAARGCSEPVVSRLLKSRIEVNQRNHQGETALMVAAENGCAPVVRRLIAVPGIDLLARDEWGRTAVHYMHVNWVNGLDMESLEVARDRLGKSAPAVSVSPVPAAPKLAPPTLH